ncbi:MAG: acyl-ACP--UDP-N-acetylglucosamine O-acyltransferase [Candidatus Riflebacteria bacterium]|nr:acyl-ACP--UDP-N-acetylglucosamine O-acyltransferase [Candidatus Riflebacteria bacterium]
MAIHQTAIVSQKAEIHPSVEIGPYCVIGPDVTIGENTVVGSNCFIDGITTIGKSNKLFPFVSIGCPPQDLKYSGQKTFVKIGDNNSFREYVTVHRAEGEGNSTTIANDNLFMAYGHVAHNCHVGSFNVLANSATLAGHVHVADRATIGGFVGIHQFCHVGSMVMIGGMSKIVKDVPPFIKIDGNPARVIGLNSVGLRRNGVTKEGIEILRQVFRIFFRSEYNVSQAVEKLKNDGLAEKPYVRDLIDFIKDSHRGIYKRVRQGSNEAV